MQRIISPLSRNFEDELLTDYREKTQVIVVDNDQDTLQVGNGLLRRMEMNRYCLSIFLTQRPN